TDQANALPIGIPMLMMGFTQDGQLNEQLLTERDKRFGVSSAQNRERRADIQYPSVDPDANAWERNIVVQLRAEQRGNADTARP
ncbi:MAG: DUF1264 domain-containing protein, partial [Povalibacter sp.]